MLEERVVVPDDLVVVEPTGRSGRRARRTARARRAVDRACRGTAARRARGASSSSRRTGGPSRTSGTRGTRRSGRTRSSGRSRCTGRSSSSRACGTVGARGAATEGTIRRCGSRTSGTGCCACASTCRSTYLRLACAASGTTGLERTGVGHTCIAAGEGCARDERLHTLDDSRLSGVRTSHDSRGAASDRSGKSSGDGGDGMRSSGASTCPMLCSGDDTTSRGNSPNTKANTMRTMRATKTNRR